MGAMSLEKVTGPETVGSSSAAKPSRATGMRSERRKRVIKASDGSSPRYVNIVCERGGRSKGAGGRTSGRVEISAMARTAIRIVVTLGVVAAIVFFLFPLMFAIRVDVPEKTQ